MSNRRDAFDRGIAAYFIARTRIVDDGFGYELDWYERRAASRVDVTMFLSEAAWVILNSGFRETVVRGRFPRITSAFGGFASAEEIVCDSDRMVRLGCRVLSHKSKMNAIVAAARWWSRIGQSEVARMRNDGDMDPLMQIPYIGVVTVWHLAKNLGFPVAKPDRHVQRIASTLGFVDTHALCGTLGDALGLTPAIVDTVFWRYATVEANYLSRLGGRQLWRSARQAAAQRN